jgi:hypothetical protein
MPQEHLISILDKLAYFANPLGSVTLALPFRANKNAARLQAAFSSFHKSTNQLLSLVSILIP